MDSEAPHLSPSPSSQTMSADPLIPSILFHVSCKVPKASGGNNAGDYGLAEKQPVSHFTRIWTALVVVHLITQRCQQRRMSTTHGLKILKLRPRQAAPTSAPTSASIELAEGGHKRSRSIVAKFLILKCLACHFAKLQQL